MITKQMIEDAKKLALSEIEKYGHPGSFESVNKKGQEIAKKLKANKDIVLLGTILMDLKLGEALHKDIWPKHVDMSVKEVKKFLNKYKLTDDETDKIINCIEAHHKDVQFRYMEAEICCNADCYRFLDPKRFLKIYHKWGKDGKDFDKTNEFMEQKVDEKFNNLTLDICREELTPYYKIFKDLIRKAREE